jgi:hypothetical protein
MEASCPPHAPAALQPEKQSPVNHWRGGWVVPKAGLDAVEKRNTLIRAGNRAPAVHPVARRNYYLTEPTQDRLLWRTSVVKVTNCLVRNNREFLR